jgi:hypothetical protein
MLAKPIIVDRHGRRLPDDLDLVPDGATLRVPVRFADAKVAHVQHFADYNKPLVLDVLGRPATGPATASRLATIARLRAATISSTAGPS